ncbi:MAG: hypothetical protein P8Y76_00815 [bacterium]
MRETSCTAAPGEQRAPAETPLEALPAFQHDGRGHGAFRAQLDHVVQPRVRQILFRGNARRFLAQTRRRWTERGLASWGFGLQQHVGVARGKCLFRPAPHTALLAAVVENNACDGQRTYDQKTKLKLAHD